MGIKGWNVDAVHSESSPWHLPKLEEDVWREFEYSEGSQWFIMTRSRNLGSRSWICTRKIRYCIGMDMNGLSDTRAVTIIEGILVKMYLVLGALLEGFEVWSYIKFRWRRLLFMGAIPRACG